ncbi:MAG: 3-hydroxyacyl-ACP dehydratase FabZ family protein [Longimicrobiales bacterium]|nr:3-hydroxyacyl-ACP dehydratase FabZ family protein [Longimicrobiales bacterium]
MKGPARNRRGSDVDLVLGPATVQLLLPHRRPFLMVDGVDAFDPDPPARIEAHRHVSMNEPYFAGHFPEMPLWPGALTMEGLGQCAALLSTLGRLVHGGGEGDDALEWLRNIDRGYRMHPGYRPDSVPPLLRRLRTRAAEVTVGAAVDMKFLKPVFPGCRLDYVVELTDDFGDRVRFTGEARVEGEPVVRGTITGAIVSRPMLDDGE